MQPWHSVLTYVFLCGRRNRTLRVWTTTMMKRGKRRSRRNGVEVGRKVVLLVVAVKRVQAKSPLSRLNLGNGSVAVR